MGIIVKEPENDAKTKLKLFLQQAIDSLDNQKLTSFHIDINPIFDRNYSTNTLGVLQIESVEYVIVFRVAAYHE